MDFLANENFPLRRIELLKNAGHNVASVIQETPGAKDLDILRRAYKENRVVLTFDRDYGELIYRHRSFIPGGVVYFRFDPSTPEKPAEILLKVLKQSEVSILGKFTVVESDRIRQRTLHEIK